ncbi:MAG TPA: hypothetical protein VLA67_11875 [Nitrospiraceae bacterium]|nr:hypothetical protein [Nitrospiraceae bacterium]
MKQGHAGARTAVWLLGLCIFVTGCASSLYGWQVRTNSTPMPPSFNPAALEQHSVALFGAVTSPPNQGNEVTLSSILEQILNKVKPNWKVVPAHELVKRINQKGLAEEYARMRAEYERTNILEGSSLRKIATGVGVRYVFQPRLISFSQTLTERWSFVDVRIMQTRSSIMRVSLQLWNAETGEIIWASIAEATMQNEAISQDPVYLEDISRVTLASMGADFVKRKTASRYSPVNKVLNDLIEEAMPSQSPDNQETLEPEKQ